MDFNVVLHGIKNSEIVDLVRYKFNIMLENEHDACENEIIDRVKGRLDEDNKVLVKFTSLNKEKTLLICFKPYDYEVVECSVSFDLKVKRKNIETEQQHFERRKNYFKFIEKYVERIYGMFGKEKYEKRANAIISRYEEKNALEN